VRVKIITKGRMVREKPLDYREELAEKMRLSAADFRNLRQKLVKLRDNLSADAQSKS